jgi:hypothetical protein
MADNTLVLKGADFGSARVGDQKIAQFTLTNNSGAAIDFTSEVAGDGFRLISGASVNLADKGTFTVDVAFAPDVEGFAKGTLKVTGGATDLKSDLNAEGVTPLEYVPIGYVGANIRFGTVATNTVSDELVRLFNGSSKPVNYTLNFRDGKVFKIATQPAPNSLASKASVDFLVQFSPTADKEYVDNLDAVRNAAGGKASRYPASVILSGTGGGIQFSPQVSPTTHDLEIDFGTLRVGESTTQKLQLTNTDKTVDHKITIAENITPPITSDLADKTPTIPAGQQLEIAFTFSPVKSGTYGPGDQSVTISGKALPGRQNVVHCGLKGICETRSIWFGDVQVQTSSQPKKIDFRNRWGSKVTISLSTKKPFSVSPVKFTLDVSQTKDDIEVVFTPTAAGVTTQPLNVKITLDSGKQFEEEIGLGGNGTGG